MGKAVLLSIKPQYCELIASGKKTVEVRKTKPKLEPPYKVYIYCTLSGSNEFFKETCNGDIAEWNRSKMAFKKGKVIGEFVCNKIDRIIEVPHTCFYIMGATVNYSQEIEKRSCLDGLDMGVYLGVNGKGGYAWHISDLVIYGRPKELSEFRLYDCGVKFEDGYPMPTHEIKRPPQSWCYVEELEGEL